jgi:hypothetical protein
MDMATGLRRGELTGIKWGDIDFANLLIDVQRSVVDQVVPVEPDDFSPKASGPAQQSIRTLRHPPTCYCFIACLKQSRVLRRFSESQIGIRSDRTRYNRNALVCIEEIDDVKAPLFFNMWLPLQFGRLVSFGAAFHDGCGLRMARKIAGLSGVKRSSG